MQLQAKQEAEAADLSWRKEQAAADLKGTHVLYENNLLGLLQHLKQEHPAKLGDVDIPAEADTPQRLRLLRAAKVRFHPNFKTVDQADPADRATAEEIFKILTQYKVESRAKQEI